MSQASSALPPLLQSFSLDSPEFIENPYPFFATMLAEAPVFYHEPSLCWFVSPYRLVKPLMRDERFSLDFRDWKFMPEMPVTTDFDRLCQQLLFGLDRRQHLRIRRLAIPAFSPKAVDAMRKNIYAKVEQHIAQLPDQFDFVTDVADKLPLEIVMQWIGIAPEREAQFTPLSNKIRALYDPTYHVDATDIQQGIDAVLAEINDTRKTRREGFIDTLVNHVDDGDSLDDWEILTLIASLIAAGPDTTSDYVKFSVMELSKRPEAIKAINTDAQRWLWPAMEEASRVDFFGKAGAVRFAREDVDIEGHRIAKGDMLRLMVGAAYYDSEVFANPHEFKLDRDLSPLLTFGYGAHFCLGAALARTISECIVQALFARRPHIVAGKPSFIPHATTRHMTSLPMQA